MLASLLAHVCLCVCVYESVFVCACVCLPLIPNMEACRVVFMCMIIKEEYLSCILCSCVNLYAIICLHVCFSDYVVPG